MVLKLAGPSRPSDGLLVNGGVYYFESSLNRHALIDYMGVSISSTAGAFLETKGTFLGFITLWKKTKEYSIEVMKDTLFSSKYEL